jgi:uncharacterized protein YnzC (UPF0291/DUF896 family)
MGFDSTADLLFRIGADTGGAESNIARFRGVMSKNLGAMGAEFGDWAHNVFGSLNSVASIATAGLATLAAGMVAAGAAALSATDRYRQYVEEVDRGSRVTGISAENISALKFAAQAVGTQFDSLTMGLARFTAGVVKGAQGSEQQLTAFKHLGITQKDLQAGEQNMLPLLEKLADHFAGLKNQTDRTAEARDLFGRSGAKFVEFLSLGKDGLKKMADEAQRLGLIVGGEDVKALHEYQAAMAASAAVQQSLDNQIGQRTLPLVEAWSLNWRALVKAIVEHPIGPAFIGAYFQNLVDAKAAINAVVQARERLGKSTLEPVPEKVGESYDRLSKLMETLRGRMASLQGDAAKTAYEYQQTVAELSKAFEELKKKQAAGALAPGVFDAEMAAYRKIANELPALYIAMVNKIGEERRQAAEGATVDLQSRLLREAQQTRAAQEAAWTDEMNQLVAKYNKEGQLTQQNADLIAALRKAGLEKIRRQAQQQDVDETVALDHQMAQKIQRTLAGEHAAWDAEVDELRRGYQAKGDMTAQNEAKLVALRAAGHAKIDADNKAAFDQEMARLGEESAKIHTVEVSRFQQIQAQYQADVAKFSAAEEAKRLAVATSEAQRAAIMAQFVAIRKALYNKEAADLQALRNSQGWQAVFGAPFAQMIRGNEALTREWASSTYQSMMLVRVSLEGVKESAQQAFAQFAQGMGQNIANAILYKKSIGEAMKAALASTLENLAGQAITYAIYSLALGFTRLAERDFAAATQAFIAVGIWGSVGAAAAVAGRAIAPSQAGSSASAAPSTAAASSSQAAGSTQAAPAGPHVTINIMGHIIGSSGVGELCKLISDAVVNSGHTLTATNTTTGRQTIR